MLFFFSSPPFYTDHVQLPNADTPLSPKIQENPKFYPFFKDAVGAHWMEPIFFAMLQQQNSRQLETTKAQ